MTHPIRSQVFGKRQDDPSEAPSATTEDATLRPRKGMPPFWLIAALIVFVYWVGGGFEKAATEKVAATVSTAIIEPGPIGRFDDVVSKFRERLECGTVSSGLGLPGYGRLYSCILGDAQTAKLFVNEDGGGNVKNLKAMWNDWHTDVGFGKHADLEEMFGILMAVSKVYPGTTFDVTTKAFGQQAGLDLPADAGLKATYTWHHGPAIDERMVVIEGE